MVTEVNLGLSLNGFCFGHIRDPSIIQHLLPCIMRGILSIVHYCPSPSESAEYYVEFTKYHPLNLVEYHQELLSISKIHHLHVR